MNENELRKKEIHAIAQALREHLRISWDESLEVGRISGANIELTATAAHNAAAREREPQS